MSYIHFKACAPDLFTIIISTELFCSGSKSKVLEATVAKTRPVSTHCNKTVGFHSIQRYPHFRVLE